MQKLNPAITPVLPSLPRNCARCGSDFRAFGREYICPGCRKPKARVRKPSSHRLSFREQQIVALVQEAKANKEIAHELRLTEGTVKEYLHHIFRKLCVRSRTELALRSFRGEVPTSCTRAGQTPVQARPARPTGTVWGEVPVVMDGGQPPALLS